MAAKRKQKLRVYCWIGHWRANQMPSWVPKHHRQSTEIIATTSMKRAAQIYAGDNPVYSPRSLDMHTIDEESNEAAVALTKPHTVFWQPLDSVGEHKNEWFEGESEKT